MPLLSGGGKRLARTFTWIAGSSSVGGRQVEDGPDGRAVLALRRNRRDPCGFRSPAYQKSLTRPFRSQSLYRVGSGPAGPPSSLVGEE